MDQRRLLHAPLAATVCAATACAAAVLAAPGSAAAAAVTPAALVAPAARAAPDAVVGLDAQQDRTLPLVLPPGSTAPPGDRSPAAPAVGDVRDWPALDDGGVTPSGVDEPGGVYLKPFTLRAVGEGVEVWVTDDLAFPGGDCRNTVGGGEAVTVTDQQVADVVEQFDGTVLPAESAAFSVAPERDGSQRPALPALDAAYPADQWTGPGGRTVVLVDNVRDQNFRDPTAAEGKTYIAGFFSAGFTDLLDRNTMVVDAFDWVHRTGEAPPDDSAAPDYAACVEAIGGPAFGDPRPRRYEGVVAHEHQHLLESYEDADEATWVNEGLSDWAQTLTGYVDPSLPPADERLDSHLGTFLGSRPDSGGPEQSLTVWGDQGPTEVLGDYGIAYAFMEHLHGRFGGDELMAALHREDAGGLVGLDAVLDELGHEEGAQQVLHDFLASMAVDAALDGGARVVTGKAEAQLQTASMSAQVAWDSAQSHDAPGAPPNGADYVRLRGADGYAADGALTFAGATSYPSTPDEEEATAVAGWTVQLVGYDDERVSVVELPLEATPEGWTWSGDASDVLGFTPQVTAALVTADDPGEQAEGYAPYTLTVDGVLQPGGGTEQPALDG